MEILVELFSAFDITIYYAFLSYLKKKKQNEYILVYIYIT